MYIVYSITVLISFHLPDKSRTSKTTHRKQCICMIQGRSTVSLRDMSIFCKTLSSGGPSGVMCTMLLRLIVLLYYGNVQLCVMGNLMLTIKGLCSIVVSYIISVIAIHSIDTYSFSATVLRFFDFNNLTSKIKYNKP